MRNKQTGFTLIELVVVIVILGILSAVALPKFISLTGEADQAATSGVAGALASATAINYAAKVAGNASTVAVTSCSAATSAMLSMPAGYTVSTGGGALTLGGTANCTVTGGSAKIAPFVAIGA